MKCEVLENCVIAVGKGSIVEVSEKQFELARRVLKPLEKKEKEAKAEKVNEEAVETAELPKAKKSRSK